MYVCVRGRRGVGGVGAAVGCGSVYGKYLWHRNLPGAQRVHIEPLVVVRLDEQWGRRIKIID